MHEFLWGAIAMACWIAGLFFFRFWRETRDRLFFIFGLAFWVFSVNWSALAMTNPESETRFFLYLIRLAAFLLIIGAVVDKNRSLRR